MFISISHINLNTYIILLEIREGIMKDLTKGNEAKLILYFAIPMFIGNIFQQLYNTVDSFIVGRFLGKEALASVGLSFPVIFLLVSLIMGITMGSTILISQYYGAKDFESVKKSIDTAYIFLFVGSIAITILGLLFSGVILRILRTPPELMPQAKTYLNIIFAGIFSMFGYNSVSAILRGLGDSKTPVYFLVVSTIINTILDLVFVVVFKWGVAGAAWATVIAQACSFAFGIIYLNRTHDVIRFNLKTMKFDKNIFRLSVKIGLPTGVQQMLFSMGMMALQSIINPFGQDTIAAFTAGSRVDSFAAMPIMNFGAAISTFVGQNLGANKPERVKKGFIATLAMSSAVSVAAIIVLLTVGKYLVGFFNSDPNVIKIGARYLAIISPFYITISIMFVTNGLLRGSGDTTVPMIISILTLWLIRVPVASYLSGRIGSDGIWWSMPIGWTIGMLLTLGYYATGKWKGKVVAKRLVPDGE
jgi:putative MATE family efflux protein